MPQRNTDADKLARMFPGIRLQDHLVHRSDGESKYQLSVVALAAFYHQPVDVVRFMLTEALADRDHDWKTVLFVTENDCLDLAAYWFENTNHDGLKDVAFDFLEQKHLLHIQPGQLPEGVIFIDDQTL